MTNPFEIVKDSSIWFNSEDRAAANSRNNALRIGIVKDVGLDEESEEFRYLVEIQNHNDKIEINCRILSRMGGVYNYEDCVLRGYKYSDSPDPVDSFDAKAGDVVLVGLLNGQGREGVILGGLSHPARTPNLDPKDGPQYESEFNGVLTEINKDGEYIVTFKGLPTNLSSLEDTPSNDIEAPKYDEEVGGTFLKFDKEGGWEVNDKASSDPQFIKIDKKNGTIELSSGAKISLKTDKASGDTKVITF